MKKELMRILIRGLHNVVGFKFLIFVLSSYFLSKGKISEQGWVQVCLTMGGLRAATDVSGILRGQGKSDGLDQR